ncbi:MAG: MFS transporter, partial [Muribaculaceae bacterium]|nr:MFS transporter [Muribaculaceae bacterium]
STIAAIESITPEHKLVAAHIAVEKNGEYEMEQVQEIASVSGEKIMPKYETVLNAQSAEYQAAGDWNGVLFAIQAVAALLWAAALPRFRSRKLAYSFSLLLGAVGFISVWFLGSKWGLTISYALMGCGWAAMLAMPFTILTNALSGKNIGTYLGLFNCTICLPQIVAAVLGGLILGLFPLAENGTAPTYMMVVLAGVLMLIGSFAVWNIKETSGEKGK